MRDEQGAFAQGPEKEVGERFDRTGAQLAFGDRRLQPSPEQGQAEPGVDLAPALPPEDRGRIVRGPGARED